MNSIDLAGFRFRIECLQTRNNELYVRIDALEHEVGELKEKLRRIVGFVTSTWREEVQQ